MTYKTNTPNYKTKNVTNFSDFIDNIDSEKEELKDVKRGINPNTNDTQKYPRNTKYKYNKVTRKLDDISLDEVEDKINAIDSIEESVTDTNIASMKRFLDDYERTHNPFEKRGMDEGVEILRTSKDIETAIVNINKKIDELSKRPNENTKDIIKGYKDLIKHLESKLISESKIDDDMFIKLTNKPSYKDLIENFNDSIHRYVQTLGDTDFDAGDNDHYLALSTAVTEACNTAFNQVDPEV